MRSLKMDWQVDQQTDQPTNRHTRAIDMEAIGWTRDVIIEKNQQKLPLYFLFKSQDTWILYWPYLRNRAEVWHYLKNFEITGVSSAKYAQHILDP